MLRGIFDKCPSLRGVILTALGDSVPALQRITHNYTADNGVEAYDLTAHGVAPFSIPTTTGYSISGDNILTDTATVVSSVVVTDNDGEQFIIDNSGLSPLMAVEEAGGVWSVTFGNDGSVPDVEVNGTTYSGTYGTKETPTIALSVDTDTDTNPTINDIFEYTEGLTFVPTSETVTVQWREDGVDVPGADASTYTPTSPSTLSLVETVGSFSAASNDIVVTGPSAGVVTSNLLLHLDASDPASYPGSGDDWLDLSGNNHHMKLYGPSYDATSEAMDFDHDFAEWGSCDGTVTGAVAATVAALGLTGNPDMTVVIVLKTTGSPKNNQGWYDLGTHGSANRHFALKQAGADATAWQCQRWGDADYTFTLDASTDFKMVTSVHDSSSGGTSYVDDNTLLASDPDSQALSLDGTRPFQMGRWRNNTEYMTGQVKSVLIYSKVLSAAEITQNYNSLI